MTTSLNKTIPLTLFHGFYDVFIGTDMQQLFDLAAQKYGIADISDFEAGTQGYTCSIDGPEGTSVLVFICTTPIPGAPKLSRTINHEALHLSWYILDKVGVKVDTDNHEVQAYLLEDLIDQINTTKDDFLRSLKKK